MIAQEAAGRADFLHGSAARQLRSNRAANEDAILTATSTIPVLAKPGKARHQLGQTGPTPRAQNTLAPALPRDPGVERPSSAAGFYLFILVNAVLLIRPAEIIPELRGIELYFYAIALCSL